MFTSYIINTDGPYHEVTRIYSETYRKGSYSNRVEDRERIRRIIRDSYDHDLLFDAMDGTLAQDHGLPRTVLMYVAYEMTIGHWNYRVVQHDGYAYHCPPSTREIFANARVTLPTAALSIPTDGYTIVPRWLEGVYQPPNPISEMLWEVYTIDSIYGRLDGPLSWLLDETCHQVFHTLLPAELDMQSALAGKKIEHISPLSDPAMTVVDIGCAVIRMCRHLDPIKVWGVFGGYMIAYLTPEMTIMEAYELIRGKLLFTSRKGYLTTFNTVVHDYADISIVVVE